MSVTLVSCVSKKLQIPAAARDLYCSPWFALARAYTEQSGEPWYILSAEYGLVEPSRVLIPYESRLSNLPLNERLRWAIRTHRTFKRYCPMSAVNRTVTIFAGRTYREFLMLFLENTGYDVHVPLEHMRIGEQLSWLKKHVKR